MKAILKSVLLLAILLLSVPPGLAGYKIPGSSDGEDLGRPERPNPTLGAPSKVLGADPVGKATREKMKAHDRAKLRDRIKKNSGRLQWDGLEEFERTQRFEQKVQEKYDEANAPNIIWDGLSPEQRQQKLQELRNNPAKLEWLECLIFLDFGCAFWDGLNAEQQEALLREEAAIEQAGGAAAWDALTDEQRDAAIAGVDFDARAVAKVEAARCNVAIAIAFIKCIPVPDPNPLNVPSGAAVADCLQKTWEKRRICIDFAERSAFGSIKPNCKGKEAGVCEPDSNPINISVNTIPCDKRTKVYDPDLYLVITTLYHEGIHALQAYNAKPAAPAAGAGNAEVMAYGNAVLDSLLRKFCNELETHGAENTLIDALCAEVLKVAGDMPAAHGGHPYLKKVLECFTTITDVAERKAAAKAFKDKLNFNEAQNRSALRGYNAKKAILQNGGLTLSQKLDGLKRASRKTLIFNGNPIMAGGDSGLVEQFAYDPVDGSEIPMGFDTPLDEIYDLVAATGGSTVLVFGADFTNGEGAMFAYSDLDGDGFLDPDSQQELVRDLELLAPVDIVEDHTNGQFLMVNLLSGEIYSLFEGQGFETFDLLPDAYFLVGQLELQPGLDFVERVVLSPDGNTIIGLPDIVPVLSAPPMLLPEMPLPSSTIGEDGFLPNPIGFAFKEFLFPPVIIEADGLAVIDTTSVINDGTKRLLIGGMPNSELRLRILPTDPPIEPIQLGPDGQFLFELPLPLQPGMEIVLILPDMSGPELPPLFDIGYIVRDSTPQLLLPQFDPESGFTAQLIGIPGLPYEIGSSPDLVMPFEPLPLSPVIGGELPLQLPPIVLDPILDRMFFRAQVMLPVE